MNESIILVGCGNIGSRHLESLMKISSSLSIDVVEPNKNAVDKAKKILKEMKPFTKNRKITWHESIKTIKEHKNIAIIATTSNFRQEIVKTLLKKGTKQMIIEKPVCQSKEEYQKIIESLKKQNCACWINTSRRYFESYKKIYQKLKSEDEIHITVIGGKIGLGSNLIHFLDLFVWFSQQKKISLNGEFLDEKLVVNKRGKNFTEFSGTIIGKNKNSTISVTSSNIDHSKTIVEIFSKKIHVIIDEKNEEMHFISKNLIKSEKFVFEPVSNTTTKIIQDIINTNSCKLPKIDEQYFIHDETFKVFNKHLKKLGKRGGKKCPIT